MENSLGIIFILLLGAAAGSIISLLFLKSKRLAKKQDSNSLGNEIHVLQNKLTSLSADKEDTRVQLEKEREQRIHLSNELTQSQTEYKNLQERLREQKAEVEELNKKFSLEFKNLAQEIFEEKSKKFTEQNKNNLTDLLNPLKEKISEFQKKVEDTNKQGIERNSSLSQQIKHLSDLNKQITKEAENLTKALKGDSKAQGNWGEVILERILEKSGLQKGREYETQVSVTNDEGKRFQPDVIVHLPDDKKIIIDAKVSLTAYERFSSQEDNDLKISELKTHIQSVKTHVKSLSEKNYQSLYDIEGLDFVLLFIPIEPAFTLAVQNDSEMFNDAYARNIVIVSPTTLIATLRTISSIWKQENQNKNALEIARQGGALYDKFQGFTEDLLSIGKHINNTQSTYQDAMKKLAEGNGNLVRKTEQLKKLGVKTTKNLDPVLLERSENHKQ